MRRPPSEVLPPRAGRRLATALDDVALTPSRRATVRRALEVAHVVLVHGAMALVAPPSRRRPGPVRLRRGLERLGGAWAKLGQLLALRFDLLPEAYCLELFALLNRIAPFAYRDVELIVGAELGAPVAELFASFASEPFGSASIGQVHEATLHDGRRVAVKVQRPGIGALLMCDIALMYRLSGVVDRLHLLGGTRSREVIDELARWTREELDYTAEAHNAITMRDRARDTSTEYEPEIHLDLTSRRVLTAEYVDGIVFADIIRELRADRDATTRRLHAAGHDLERAASNIVWNFLNQTYAVGTFHGDLHPANVLLRAGDQIGYVDFGIIATIPPEVHESLGRYAQCLFGDDAAAAVDELLRWQRPSARTDLAAARSEMTALTQRFLDDAESATARRRELLARFQVQLLAATRRHRLSTDPLMILYLKTVLTIDAVTSELAPALNLQALHERFFSELVIEGFKQSSA